MAIAIKIENLSKQYRLGLVSTRTLSHDLNRWWQTSILGREDPYLKIGEENKLTTRRTPEAGRRTPNDYVWALKDINLEVEEGEVLGIIGKNGAGKSTLLKILSKVTSPTTGTIKARGRIASLLEVGTGFHYEMTGRENIYLNGAILGMTKAEINRKLDEIIDFAGVERYIDTPVKRYSSGMLVRLGFAVAAHLDPDILIVDEVLAVGDAEFQKKAIGKMEQASDDFGRTILFVSHDMANIKRLCKETILLKNGSVYKRGGTSEIIDIYQNSSKSSPTITGLKTLQLSDFKIIDYHGVEVNTFNTFDKIKFILKYIAYEKIDNVSFAVCFNNINNTRITSIWSSFQNKHFDLLKGEFTLEITVDSIRLSPDIYEVIIYSEKQGFVLERIDNYRKIVVGYTSKFGLVNMPTFNQGYYIEKCSFNIK